MDEHIDSIDPRAELERYIVERTCQWCDRTFDTALTFRFLCRLVARQGYTLKHRKRWRVCDPCVFGGHFSKWIFPVITNILEHESLTAIMAIQPLQPMLLPAARIFYKDIQQELQPIPLVYEQVDWDDDSGCGT